MEDKDLYEQLGKMWQHYALWREKIFAGYLTALAGLGLLLSQNQSSLTRAAAFGGGIVVSLVFFVLDQRNQQCINECQDAAALLEGNRGAFATLNSLRDNGKRRASFGLGIKLLTGSVISASAGGLLIYFTRWQQGPNVFPVTPAVAVVVATFALVPRMFRWLSGNRGVPKGFHRVATLLAWTNSGKWTKPTE